MRTKLFEYLQFPVRNQKKKKKKPFIIVIDPPLFPPLPAPHHYTPCETQSRSGNATTPTRVKETAIVAWERQIARVEVFKVGIPSPCKAHACAGSCSSRQPQLGLSCFFFHSLLPGKPPALSNGQAEASGVPTACAQRNSAASRHCRRGQRSKHTRRVATPDICTRRRLDNV